MKLARMPGRVRWVRRCNAILGSGLVGRHSIYAGPTSAHTALIPGTSLELFEIQTMHRQL